MSVDNLPIGAKLFTWIADTGVLAFRMSGVARALKVLRGKKFAFKDSNIAQAYAVWDLWMIRASTVAFMLLDPSGIASTKTFLRWARQAGSSAWDVELTTDRVITMEEEVARAKSAMESDLKVMVRRVLASSVPTTTPVTQAYWIAGILCPNCINKRRALGI